ncbi:hypothetical protein [Streptomyces chattanoogensis]|uniref:hypothetical protein n=1 Tax=Streptomyces chattanoogensis TaxID=66876 RepID=UPI0005D9D961|nr:hypothetical protein T261_3935 [Streptomyces lydicus]
MADPAHKNEPTCPDCDDLKFKLAAALNIGDHSEAVDYRVLLRRHPRHDDTPVTSERKHR